MKLTPNVIYKLFPDLDWEFHEALSLLEEYDINTPLRISHFLAQVTHESNDFKVLKENLNYSQSGLLSVFKKYFTPEQALAYARKPEKIANRVYANRLGNGDEASGDGWKYRGRGAIQVTGKTNYMKCSLYLFNDERLLTNPDKLLEPKYAILSACWYWRTNNLNMWCDNNDIYTLTRRINGGLNGIEDRKKRFDRIYSIFKS
ncbi:MAG: glycoside hydrolase family 19 protein [Anaerolineales bacterium]|nr:glycoside hydrolase family 19 protein [Anaerolineales bacterium]